ncbi:MAG: hypothetical protein Q8R98_02425, partial [Rubrivivax sp.]|nr:hypothetical protein [Rubrivivax sp.]
MRKLRVTTFAALIALSGCASTPDGLRENVSGKRELVLSVGYQTVLKRLVDHNRKCVGGPLLPIGSVINDVDHYPDLRTATIVRGAQGFGRDIFQVYDLVEVAPGATRLTM